MQDAQTGAPACHSSRPGCLHHATESLQPTLRPTPQPPHALSAPAGVVGRAGPVAAHHGAKEAEGEGDEHPDEQHDDDGAKGHGCKGLQRKKGGAIQVGLVRWK